MYYKTIFTIVFIAVCLTNCNLSDSSSNKKLAKRSVIFDTDANNELDDQHALAYLLLNDDTFDIKAVTINSTYNGGDIMEHYKEAERVMQLCNAKKSIPLIKGANGSFADIKININNPEFDGYDAVNYIISEAKKHKPEQPLIALAVGKLTNMALAVEKSPEIIPNIRLVWLGSNYPESGEYNLENDIPAMNYLLSTALTFEIVVCRYGKITGADWVKVSSKDIKEHMQGKGPKIDTPVSGRYGGKFDTFGDYSVSLFKHAHYYGDPPTRSLFDMAAVAIVKNPTWASSKIISAPSMIDNVWIDHPGNERKVTLWENFDRELILLDFYESFENN